MTNETKASYTPGPWRLGGVNGEACELLPGLSEQNVVAGKIVEPKVHRVICTAQPAR